MRTARALFEVDEVTAAMRGAAKTVNYAVIYGQTQFALARNLDISREEAQRYIDAFFDQYAGVKSFLDEVVEQARANGLVTTLLGRRRSLQDLFVEPVFAQTRHFAQPGDDQLQHSGGGKLREVTIDGLALLRCQPAKEAFQQRGLAQATGSRDQSQGPVLNQIFQASQPFVHAGSG